MPGINGANWWDSAANVAPNMQNLTQAMPIDTGALSALPNIQAGPEGPNWLQSSGILGKTLGDGTQVQGWGMPALNLASGLTNAFFGYKQYQLAKDTLQNNKDQFKLNFDAQKKTTNAALEDRQNARVAANPGAYQSVGDYMKKYSI